MESTEIMPGGQSCAERNAYLLLSVVHGRLDEGQSVTELSGDSVTGRGDEGLEGLEDADFGSPFSILQDGLELAEDGAYGLGREQF